MNGKEHGLGDAYCEHVSHLLSVLRRSQAAAIDEAARLIAEAWEGGGRMLVAQTSHGLHLEATWRAGGPLAAEALDHAFDVSEGVTFTNLRAGDVVLVPTNSGTAHETVAIAVAAREAGNGTIALTQLPFETSGDVDARHPSGERLHQVVDVTIDLGGDVGDGALPLRGSPVNVAPTSGVTAMVAMWAIVARACERLTERGKVPLLFESYHLPGSAERNDAALHLWEETGLPFRALR